MFFIYPASVSENCDPQIIPAVAKCIEKFFLIQIQDAIASGVLPLSRKWQGSNYGPLLLECVNNFNKKQMLTENKIYLSESTIVNDYRTKIESILDGLGDRFTEDERDDAIKQLRSLEDELYDRQQSLDEKEDKSEINEIRRALSEIKDAKDKINDMYNEIDKFPKTDSRGAYQALDTKIDITPTSGTVSTNILYKGGKQNGKFQDNVKININVKVIPTRIKNFKILEKDLLDDYFSKKSEATYKSYGRNIARKAYNVVKHLPFGLGDVIWKAGMNLAGEDIDKESRKDIIYNTHGFVDASAFHKSSSSPNNYNYTSNIVIFNKDDLTDPEDQNIFQNRSAMVKLFKLGWSTFCMLDPVQEMMYFISSLDGGYMHPIPYRYIMESIGSKAYYGTDSRLKDSAKPFMVRRGNFANFSKLFKKR